MKHLTLNLEDEIILLNKYRMTPNELMVIRTLLLLQDENNEELFKSCIELLHDSGIQLKDVFLNLRNKGIILKSWKIPEPGNPFSPYDIPLNKSFVKVLYRSSFELGKELYDEYPMFTVINGKTTGLLGISKKFDSHEDAYSRYGKEIAWNPDTHNHIIELLKWAKDRDLVKYNFATFIVDRRWIELEEMKNGDITNVNYDFMEMQ